MTTDATKREVVLTPGTYLYMHDQTKGSIRVYVGPITVNSTAQEVPVVYEHGRGFVRVESLDKAIRTCPIAVQGHYAILFNPSRDGKTPMEGGAQASTDLDAGRRVHIPGPATFALWPGQQCEIVRGHHLHLNQYLMVRVYDADDAMKHWDSGVAESADAEGADTKKKGLPKPKTLSTGELIIVPGTQVSFYMPPTGITVVHDGHEPVVTNSGSSKLKPKYVREALTLERLEYCILIDENGSKRYEKGPMVVFPKPSEHFVEKKDKGGLPVRKFAAIELNEIQGIHLKVIASYKDVDKTIDEGTELFITGKEMPIYYPREEHSIIRYDGQTKHFATAIPAGEARYVMNRKTGEIKMFAGPQMLLPDPRIEVIIRRPLSEMQCDLWYPNNPEAAEYNRSLRELAVVTPTTRSGAVSEGELMRSLQKGRSAQLGDSSIKNLVAANYSAMEVSKVGGDQEMIGEEFQRSANYTQPRSITLHTKYNGVPSLDVWTGYAVLCKDSRGGRRVIRGPQRVLLNYDEDLESLELSTGKPKTTDKLYHTVFLQISGNKVSDNIVVETSDHVNVELKLSLHVDFEGESTKWFDVSNYVKMLCDRVRSILKSEIRSQTIDKFYAEAPQIIRNRVLGVKTTGEKGETPRPGLKFVENGMRVVDVDVLGVRITDAMIQQLLEKSQHEVVQTNIGLAAKERALTVTAKEQEILTKQQQIVRDNEMARNKLTAEMATSSLELIMLNFSNDLKQLIEKQKLATEQEKMKDISHEAALARASTDADERHRQLVEESKLALDRLKAETDSVTARFASAKDSFAEALIALQNNELLPKLAQALSVQTFLGGHDFAEALQKALGGTPIGDFITKKLVRAANGHSGTVPGAGATS